MSQNGAFSSDPDNLILHCRSCRYRLYGIDETVEIFPRKFSSRAHTALSRDRICTRIQPFWLRVGRVVGVRVYGFTRRTRWARLNARGSYNILYVMTALLYNNILHYNGARRIRDNPPRGFRGKKRRGGQNARDNAVMAIIVR